MTLAPNLEQMLRGAVQQSLPGQGPTIEPGLAESLFESLRKSANHVQEQGHNAVLVVSPSIRPWLAKSVRHRVNDMTVLSYSEIPDDQSVKIIYTVDTALR